MTSVDLSEPADDSPARKMRGLGPGEWCSVLGGVSPHPSLPPQCGNCSGAPARCWCQDCNEALCSACVSAHRRVTVTRKHKLLDQAPPEVPSISPTKFCSLHPSEALQLFCFRCNQLTCRDCQLVAHRNHSFEFISKAVESLKKQLGSSLDPLKEQMQASRRSLVDMEERLAVLSQHETFIRTKLQRNFSALADFLCRRLDRVLLEVQKVHDSERQKIQARMLKVRELQQSCMAVTAAAVQAQDVTDLLELLGCMAQIKPQVKDLISQDSAPPKTMARLRVLTDQQSMDSILQFGKIEVSWVPFSAYQAPEKDPSLHEVAPPTSSSSFSVIAPPTFLYCNRKAPPTTSSSSFSGIAPPCSSSTCSIFSSQTPPPLVSHSTAPSLSSSWRPPAFTPPVHSDDASPAPRPTSPSLPLIAPADPKKAKRADGACSPSAPPPAQTHPTPTVLVNLPAPPSTSLDPPAAPLPQPTAGAASKVRINVISRSEVAALSRLFQWPKTHYHPPKGKPAESGVPRGGRPANATYRKWPPKKTKAPGGVSTLRFDSSAPQRRTHMPSPPSPPDSDQVAAPDPPPGGLAASKLTAPSLPSPPPIPAAA